MNKDKVHIYDPIPVEEYPRVLFTNDELPSRLQGSCFRRALRDGHVRPFGIGRTNNKWQKYYIKSRLSRQELQSIHTIAVAKHLEKCDTWFGNSSFSKEQTEALNSVTKQRIGRALKETKRIYTNLTNATEYVRPLIRTAWWSDGVGSVFGATLAKVLREECGYDVEATGNLDFNSDLIFRDVRLNAEIKVMVGLVWQGGEYTNEQRLSYPTFLVSRNADCTEFWVGLVPHMTWQSSMQKGQRRYGTRAKWEMVRENPWLTIIWGGISNTGNMLMEKIH